MSRNNSNRYYVDGNTVRKRDAFIGEPVRREEPVRRKAKKKGTYKKSAAIAEQSLAFDAKYTAFLLIAVVCMMAGCIMLLSAQGKVARQKSNISSLTAAINDIQEDNLAFEDMLESKYTLEDIYNKAVNELGMVYAKKGQVVYYDNASEDYVKQYRDVPGAN